MKKAMVLLFALALIVVLQANAFAAEIETQSEIVCYDSNGQIVEPASITSKPQYGYRTVKVPVTIYTETTNGTVTSTVTPSIIRVTFKYYVSTDSSGAYVGGYGVNGGDYPKLAKLSTNFPLDVSCTKLTAPVVNIVEGHSTYYTVSIRGGSFSITYNNVLRYDSNGNLVSKSSTTETRAYSYSYTGQ